MIGPKFYSGVREMRKWQTPKVRCKTTYGGEAKGVDLNTQRGHVLLLELASQVALDEGGLNQVSHRYNQYIYPLKPKYGRGGAYCRWGIICRQNRALSRERRCAAGDVRASRDRTYLASTTVANEDELEGGRLLRHRVCVF